MSDDLGARLRTARETLSHWYDRLNSKWADAEATLRSFNLSQSLWVSFKEETYECDSESLVSRAIEHCLGFMKHGAEWRICYAIGETGDPDSFLPRPVLDSSLEDRVLALEGLPMLLERIVEEAESESARLEVALGAAAESLVSIKAAM